MPEESIAENKPKEIKIEGNRQAPLSVEELYQTMLDNISSIDSKFNTLKDFFEKATPFPRSRITGGRENILSAMETQLAPFTTNYLSGKEIELLVSVMNSTSDEAYKLAISDKEREKITFIKAKTEAALKGFSVDLSSAAVQQMKVEKRQGLSQDEVGNLQKPLSQAMMKLADKKIPKEQYREELINSTLEILEGQGISKSTSDNYKKFMEANTTPKLNGQEKISDEKRIKELKEKTAQMTKFFEDKLKENEIESKNLAPVVSVIKEGGVKNSEIADKLSSLTDMEVIKKLSPSLVVNLQSSLKPKEVEKNCSNIIKNFAPLLESKNEKLVKAMESLLKNSDADFLAEHAETIKVDLEKASKTSILDKIRSFVTGWDKLENATKYLEKENNYYIDKRDATNKITKSNYTGKQIAEELSGFVSDLVIDSDNKNKILKNKRLKGLVNKDGSTNITPETYKEIDLVELRKINPTKFDELFHETLPPPPPEVTKESMQVKQQIKVQIPPPPSEKEYEEYMNIPPPPKVKKEEVQPQMSARAAPQPDSRKVKSAHATTEWQDKVKGEEGKTKGRSI